MLRFGFDAIFAAIGFSGVALDPDTVVVDDDPACLEVDEEPDVVTLPVVAVGLPDDFALVVVGLPVLRVVVATGLPVVVGLPVVRVCVDAAGLPLVIGFPLVVGLPVLRVVVDVTGLPLVAGLTDAGGLPDPLPRPWANAGDSAKDAAAMNRESSLRLAYGYLRGGESQARCHGDRYAILLKSNFLGELVEQF